MAEYNINENVLFRVTGLDFVNGIFDFPTKMEILRQK